MKVGKPQAVCGLLDPRTREELDKRLAERVYMTNLTHPAAYHQKNNPDSLMSVAAEWVELLPERGDDIPLEPFVEEAVD